MLFRNPGLVFSNALRHELHLFSLPRRVRERLNKVVNDRADFLRDMAGVWIDRVDRRQPDAHSAAR
jgi:hypothetical protein